MFPPHNEHTAPIRATTANTMKIMIVDDHADMRRMLRSIVIAATADTVPSVEVIECEEGEEAVRLHALQHPALVLMDVQLRAMNGFEATERIYQHDPGASIIFVTSHATSVFRAKAQSLRSRGFVSKDNLSELTRMLHQVLSITGGDH